MATLAGTELTSTTDPSLWTWIVPGLGLREVTLESVGGFPRSKPGRAGTVVLARSLSPDLRPQTSESERPLPWVWSTGSQQHLWTRNVRRIPKAVQTAI